MKGRRRFLQYTLLGGLAAACTPSRQMEQQNGSASEVALQPINPSLDIEPQQSDPGLVPETIEFNPLEIESMSTAEGTMGTVAARIDDFQVKFLETCRGFLGVNRTDDQPQIERYLRLFNLGFYRSGTSPNPYCAAGVSYAAARTYLDASAPVPLRSPPLSNIKRWLVEVNAHHFYPTVSVQDMYFVARGTRRWVSKSASVQPKPGWLILFKFGSNSRVADHVGVVESYDQRNNIVETIEFNTTVPSGTGSDRDGGYVARRERLQNSSVVGYIDTNFRNPFR